MVIPTPALIGIDMNSLRGAGKVFYEDQKENRKFRISEEIDKEYIQEKERESLKEKMEEKECEQYELEEMEDEPLRFNENLNQSTNRSGSSRSTVAVESSSTQTEFWG